jgi:hypothetical protein
MCFIYIKFIIIFLFKKKFVLINSPFQYVNFYEYSKKYTIYADVPVLIGFCDDDTENQIQSVNKNLFLKNEKVFYLKRLFYIKFFHFLLYLKKKITGFDECIIGDINYYLFKEFYKHSKKNIILDDGTSTLEIFNKKNFTKNTKFFTIFQNNKKKKFYLKNNFFFLKKNIKKIQRKEKSVYILGTVLLVYKIISKRMFVNFIKLICARYKNYKIYYIPHRLEKNFNFLIGNNIELIRPALPIELQIISKESIPNIIISFYSTSLFSLKLIYNKNIRLYNFSFSLNKILNKKFADKYKLIQQQLYKHKITNFRY